MDDADETTVTAESASKTGKADDNNTSIKGGGIFHRFATQRNRILKFTDRREVAPSDYDIEENFQVGHANMAIASSGIIGKGRRRSVERDYLPQAFSDFIYAIIIEEMGIIGAAVIAFLYIVLLYRAARIASRCENNFPAFLVLGLALLLVIQATFNMMVAVELCGSPSPASRCHSSQRAAHLPSSTAPISE